MSADGTGNEQAHSWAAVVLAGGRGSRLGGVDKPALLVGGVSMRARVLAQVSAALGKNAPLILVGAPGPDVPDGVVCVREEPVFGGPVAGLGRALQEVRAIEHQRALQVSHVLVIGGDMPRITVDLVRALMAKAREEPTKVWSVTDADGKLQFLCALWPREAAEDALEQVRQTTGELTGTSMRRLYGLVGDRLAVSEAATRIGRHAVDDVDDRTDLARARIEFARREDRVIDTGEGEASPALSSQ